MKRMKSELKSRIIEDIPWIKCLETGSDFGVIHAIALHEVQVVGKHCTALAFEHTRGRNAGRK
jgi:predicted outer membrane lipoprotein